ncbi:MAG TPA: hypothetical protein VN700_18520 [Vicinamibacterales bacterium]|nr:hypothetical protein [Vicinamibacterales bacterium]
MNWRTGVRVGVAVIGIGVATAVFVKSRGGPPPPPLPVDPPKLDSNVSLIGGPGKLIQYKDGKPSVEITATKQTNFTDGRVRLEDALVKGLGEKTFTLRGAIVDTKGPAVSGENPNQFEISGGFKFESSDGMVVESDKGSYDDASGVMTIPGATSFRRGRISGTSNGATYERDKDAITFLDAAKADVAADANGKGVAQATSRRMIMTRGQHALQMEDGARIVGDVQVLSAQKATVGFTEDESAMKSLELTGAASVTPGAAAAAGQPSMNGDRITMSFQPDGVTMQHATLTGRAVMTTSGDTGTRAIRASWIDLFTGSDGHTLTALKARDSVVVEIPPTAKTAGRFITATTLTATGEDKKGLTSARFEGGPCFQEDTAPAVAGRATVPPDPNACTPAARAAARSRAVGGAPTRRVGSAVALVLKLGGDLDAIEEAQFQQDAVFDSGRATAKGYLATYDEKRGRLFLRPDSRNARPQPSVDTGEMTVSANEIDLETESENLEARGAVGTSTQRKPGKGQQSASLFEGDKPVFGTSDMLVYVRETGKATYTGSARTPARLVQDTTDIVAARLEFTESTSYLVARGKVDSRIVMTGPAADAKSPPRPQKYQVQADILTYDDTRRTAVYEAPLVVLTTEDGNKTEARKLTFELAKETRTLDRMRAEGGVWATLSGGYEVTGDLLVYQADTDIYTVTGKPAIVKSKEQSGLCKRTTSAKLEMNRKTGAVEAPGSPAGSSTDPMPCSESIRPPRK